MSESIIGKLNLETLKNVYQGGTTPTSEVVVDNTNNIIYVNSHPDSTYVDERIDAKIALLDNAGQTCATGEVISSVSETDGIISVSKKSLTVNDIPTLTHTKISDWDSNIDGKIHLHNYSNIAHEDIRTAISNEATARANADTTLQSNIDAEALARQQADTAESTARSSADTALGGRIDSEAQTRGQADETLLDNIDAEESRATLAETAITQDLTAHKNNTSNPHSVTKAQVGLSDVVNKPMDNTPTTDSLNYITSGGVKSYVDTYGGKIDTITVNGQQSPLPIENKNVTIPKVKKNGTDITLTNNAFDVIVPTKTSDITNDSDYRTGAQVSTSISTHDSSESAHSYIRGLITSEANTRSQADTTLQSNIDAEALTRGTADTSLGNRIDAEVLARGNADTALGGRIDSEALARSGADTTLQGNIDSEAATRLAQDNLRILISNIINNTSSTDTDKPLSANMGKELLDLINNLKSVGRFLSNWNAITGLPTTDPTVSPYTYHTGDYYLVSVADNASQYLTYDPTHVYNIGDKCRYNSAFYICNTDGTTGEWDATKWNAHTITNYKPDGSTYTTGVPSTTQEPKELNVGDYYVYDSTQWILLSNTLKTVTFENIAGSPYDNANLASALNSKAVNTTAKSVTDGTNTLTNLVEDASYVHTDNNFTTIEKTKLTNIAVSTTAKSVTDGTNTLSNLVSDASYVHTDNNYTTADKNLVATISGKESTSNKTLTIDSSSTSTQYPSALAVYNAITSHVPADMTGATESTSGTHGLVPAPQAGDQNKYLQGNGTWTTVDALPSQTGLSGKFLTTNGTTASWDNVIVSNTSFGTFVTNAVNTQYTYNHGLNTQAVMVQVSNSAYETILVDITRTNNNIVTIEFGTAPGVGTYNIYCVAPTTTAATSGEEVYY